MRGPRHAAGARRIAANIAKLPELLPAPRTRTGGVSKTGARSRRGF